MTLFSKIRFGRLGRVCLPLALLCTTLVIATPARADLEKIQKSGVLRVAVYENFAPFSTKAGGIDIDLADALAKKLGLKLTVMPFTAGEELGDDLRNMVWKGHYLGYGPADLMLHVPVDPQFVNGQPQVKVFAPYHTETVKLVRNVEKVPQYNGLASLAGKQIGVEKVSISAIVLLGEENGRYRDDVKIFGTPIEALEKLKAGELDAVLANRSEIESVLGNDARFEMREVSFMRLPRKGWTVGMAVKKDNAPLAKLLQDATDELFASGEMAKIFAKHGVQIVRP